jgi:hypothetical protein
MNSERNSKKSRIEAVVIALLFIGTVFIVPVSTFAKNPPTTIPNNVDPKNVITSDDSGPFILDRSYYLIDSDPASTEKAGDNHDAGYKKDAGNSISNPRNLYPGEVIDDTPGRGRTATLSTTDTEDWYRFSACVGQQIVLTMTPASNADFDLYLWTGPSSLVASSENLGNGTMETIVYPTSYVGMYYMQVKYKGGTGENQYTFDVTLNGQNDAYSGTDASNTLAGAYPITPGLYPGYLDMNDPYDFYQFQVTTGQGIHLKLTMSTSALLADFDLQLYNPSGKLIYEGNQYYNDEFTYPADVSGFWSTRVDIFPGWVDVPHPTNWSYYSYGSGAYNLTLSLESNPPAAPPAIPEPQITPIAQTFKVVNDPASNKDDYGYLAAIPACNYLDGGKRYLAPIIYTGDTTPTAYYDDNTSFGTVDDTTQYLVDDWNTYLATYGKTPVEYPIPADPIQAASDIAKQGWTSSQTAVVAVDGSGYQDTVKTVLQKTKTLTRKADIVTVQSDDQKLKSGFGYLMFLGPKWGALAVNVTGINSVSQSLNGAVLTQVLPKFMDIGSDDWPVPYDGKGYSGDIYMPVTRMGLWSASCPFKSQYFDAINITKYAGDRYHFKVNSNDAVIDAVLTTEQPSDLLVFLVDPQGNLRAPTIPAWNGPVNPIHMWNGLENPVDNPWRSWNPAPHTEFTAQVLHPEKGSWTAIVVPRNAAGSNVKYTLTTTVRTVNPDRADAAISAANAAVIASLNHYPLLYVNKDSVPAATTSAFSQLGVTKVIFVERGEIGAGVRSQLPTVEKDLKTMQEIVDEIKGYPASENYITVTSLKTGDGFFAPAAMLAAYHGAPVIRVEDSPDGDPAAVADRIQNWQRWDGDYYHGSRANGHMPKASSPLDQNNIKMMINLTLFLLNKTDAHMPLGRDMKRYWNQEMITDFHNYIVSLGLDREGQEGYCVVAPRTDINMELHSALMGNSSYAGQIPGMTPGYSSDLIVRDILYPALIIANPGRDTTASLLMNFPDGTGFTLNNGVNYPCFSSRTVKNTFASHLRTFVGHSFWLAHLQQMNDGVSVFYYSGHGTGGSGQSAMYQQTDTSAYPDQIWWDGWRGYMYDTWKTPRDGGWTWFNPEPPELYDLVHYKWIDQAYQNLRSAAVLYMSCTTGDAAAPLVFLDHGAALWYGNANTGTCPEADLADDQVFQDTLVNGISIGVSFSHQVWLHYRDFTYFDNTSMYGPSSMSIDSIQVIYGDPSLVFYSPEWTSPVPIDA